MVKYTLQSTRGNFTILCKTERYRLKQEVYIRTPYHSRIVKCKIIKIECDEE